MQFGPAGTDRWPQGLRPRREYRRAPRRVPNTTTMAMAKKKQNAELSMSQALGLAADAAHSITEGLEAVRDSLRDRFATTTPADGSNRCDGFYTVNLFIVRWIVPTMALVHFSQDDRLASI